MKKTTSILLGFAFMAFLCFQATALPFLSDPSLKNSVIKAAAGYTGVVDIRKDWDPSTGFYVEANLGYYANDSQAKSNKTSTIYPEVVTKMMISLSNNETMLSVRCLDFTYYNCTSYHCQQQPTEKYYDIVYPTFMVTASLAQSYIYLDKKYWTIASTPFYLASQCLTGDLTSGLGKNRSGVLGLGTDGDAANDFKLSKKFAIYINPNLTSGQLLFTDDISYANSTNPLFTLDADSTWKTYVLSGSFVTSSGAAGFKGDLIFDINSDAIGLPYDVFTLFMVYFTKTPGLSCNADLYKPLCSIDNFQLLADITIQFDGKSIKIPPSVYAVPTTGNYFNLNLKAISPNQPGKSYVTPGYKNCIILDANFMSYYFTVFDATSGSNKIYLYEAGDKRNIIGGGDFPWGTVVVVLIILIVVIACCVAKNKTVSKEADTVVTNTTQQPLVYNYPAYTQGNAQPQGAYPTPNYTNNGYQQPQGGVYYNQ